MFMELVDMEFGRIREEKAVDTLIETLKKGNYKKANVVLGEILGHPEEFMKLYRYLVGESRLGRVKISIKSVPAKIECMKCDWKGDPNIRHDGPSCPRCLSDNVNVLRGNEFEIHV